MKHSAWGLKLLMGFIAMLCLAVPLHAQAEALAIPDISEWQGRLTATQVEAMKPRVSFVINRRQYGSNYIDKDAANNTALYVKYGIPFGEYDFSLFTNAASAREEARLFYARSNKQARFYVLDFEVDTVTSGTTNAAVAAWVQQMRALTHKKLIFYSYQSFATTYASSSRFLFDAQWIADATATPPRIPYDLWQYTDHFYMAGLNEYVDNSRVATWVHPVSWWLATGQPAPASVSQPKRPVAVKKPVPAKKVAVVKQPQPAVKKKPVAKKAVPVKKKPVTKKVSVVRKTTPPVKRVVAKPVTQNVKRQPIRWVTSDYQVGQVVALSSTARTYYGNRTKIRPSAKYRLLRVTAVKSIKADRSRQAIYLATLHQWVLSQDVTGYWAGQHGAYTATRSLQFYRDSHLRRATGRRLVAGKQINARLITVGATTVLKTSAGYLTANVTAVTPAYYERMPAQRWVRAKVGLQQYRYSTFTRHDLSRTRIRRNSRIPVKRLGERADGSRYFVTPNGRYITADKQSVTV
ncbi:GH25 family lysozyme [Lactiplantibacillus brownii]|uniref:GH25 family lysozyme n=1 Tax=Lactiplantibacillus brownii TaxID=3069269 RepID=UPI0038B30D34